VITPLEVVRQVYLYGGKLTVDGDTLRICGPEPLPDDLRRALRKHKPAIMVALGTPLDTAILAAVGDIRPYLPQALQRLSDDTLLILVKWGGYQGNYSVNTEMCQAIVRAVQTHTQLVK